VSPPNLTRCADVLGTLVLARRCEPAVITASHGRSPAAGREKALATMAGLVGALILSRAVDDPALSDEILEATATELGRR
jgi:hypothetical protein